jgi:hypothetical protein
MLLPLLQLLLAGIAIVSALKLPEETRLLVPLGCLVMMFVVSRIDRYRTEKARTRREFLKSELEKASGGEGEFFAVESLLWPRNELLLIDAVHRLFKDLGFRVSAPLDYRCIDRIVRLPDSPQAFGLEVLMSEEGLDRTHLKLNRALQFDGEKKEREKTLIVASTHIQYPLADRDRLLPLSTEVSEFLLRHRISLITARQLHQFWQEAKGEREKIRTTFQRIHAHPGGLFPL